MLLNEFKINKVDECIYIKNTKKKNYVIVCFYMNNMFILDNNNFIIKSAQKILTNKLNMINLSVVTVISGIKISREFNGLLLSQILLC